MNEINTELTGDAETVATLLAANNGLPVNVVIEEGVGEAPQPEGAYVSDDADEATHTVN